MVSIMMVLAMGIISPVFGNDYNDYSSFCLDNSNPTKTDKIETWACNNFNLEEMYNSILSIQRDVTIVETEDYSDDTQSSSLQHSNSIHPCSYTYPQETHSTGSQL